MGYFKKILADFFGLCRICGWRVGLRWLYSIALNFRQILKRRDLQPADCAVGEGPFGIELQNSEIFKICGTSAISGIREMYVRDSYLCSGLLSISEGDVVVDLGANMGNFTNLALAHGPNVRVVAVEPSAAMNSAFRKSVGMNGGFLDRTTLIQAFIGTMSDKQVGLINQDVEYKNVRLITEKTLIQEAKLTRIDFLKCDIEGGEFEFINNCSALFAMTESLAIEIHAFAGSVSDFIKRLKTSGFTVLAEKWDPDGTCTVLAKRR